MTKEQRKQNLDDYIELIRKENQDNNYTMALFHLAEYIGITHYKEALKGVFIIQNSYGYVISELHKVRERIKRDMFSKLSIEEQQQLKGLI